MSHLNFECLFENTKRYHLVELKTLNDVLFVIAIAWRNKISKDTGPI